MSDSLAVDTTALPTTLERVLARLALTKNRNFGITVAAPIIPPAQVFLALPNEAAMLWATAPGVCEVALGAAMSCSGSGHGRAQTIIERADLAFRDFQGVGLGAAAIEPRFFGGLSYASARKNESSWSSFLDSEFALPRLLYRASANRAAVTLFASKHEIRDPALRAQFVEAVQTMTQLVPQDRSRMSRESLLIEQRIDTPDRTQWGRHVLDACRLFEEGQLEKAVLAREILLICNRQPDIQSILEQLLGRAEGSVCFALRRASAIFLGATPERLVSRRGPQISTEALAGSAANSGELPEQLLSDTKNQLEHSLVVREIVARLQRLGADVSVPSAPQLRRFAGLSHLYTSLQARKLASPHVLTLADHLHPTPAVGGIPLERALEFIFAHEAFDRGRYAGPVGWFDGNGDGEFAVALRSGLLSGREVRLYAGAGLVQGSEPDAEWRETDLKFRSLLDALGLTRVPDLSRH